MIKPRRIMQTKFGPRGNCDAACLAMLLDLSIESVPCFWDTGDGTDLGWSAARDAWLSARGLWCLAVVPTLDLTPRGFHVATGYTPRGHRHGVVYLSGALWHDPHPDGGGLVAADVYEFVMPATFQPPRITP